MSNATILPRLNCGRTAIVPALLLTLLAAGASSAAQIRFEGKDLNGWRSPGEWLTARAVSLDSADPSRLAIEPGQGIYVNGSKGRTVNLVTEAEWGDVEVHVEFCISKKSNSGVYLMGRYEVQIYDSFGVEKDKYPGIECGGIYPRWTQDRGEFEGHSPRVNASKPPAQWQTFDIVFRAPRFDASGKKTQNAMFVKVSHNGQVVHENVEVTGPTRAACFEDEKPQGPLMLQGDHGPVAYRNLRVTTLRQK
jgi:hypothetical protein